MYSSTKLGLHIFVFFFTVFDSRRDGQTNRNKMNLILVKHFNYLFQPARNSSF